MHTCLQMIFHPTIIFPFEGLCVFVPMLPPQGDVKTDIVKTGGSDRTGLTKRGGDSTLTCIAGRGCWTLPNASCRAKCAVRRCAPATRTRSSLSRYRSLHVDLCRRQESISIPPANIVSMRGGGRDKIKVQSILIPPCQCM